MAAPSWHTQTMTNEPTCAAIHILLPAYSIGATDPDETAQVQHHLASCRQAAVELADYLALSDALLFSAPAVEAPAAIEDRLRALTSVPASASPEAVSRRSPGREGPWRRLRRALAAPQFRPALVLGAAALVALLVVSLYAGGQVRRLRESQAELIAQLDQQQAVLTQVGEGDFLRITLPAGPAGEATGAYATVVCNPTQRAGFVLAEGLPPLPADQAYQLWLIHGEERVSGGIFEPDSQGYGRIAFLAPQPMGEYEAIGISAEPIGGSAAPTSPAVIQGSLYGENGYQG